MVFVVSNSRQNRNASAQEESNWRKTRYGWVETSAWDRPATYSFERRIELVHPLIFTALVVLFSIAALIWATEEYDWGQITCKRPETIREKLSVLDSKHRC